MKLAASMIFSMTLASSAAFLHPTSLRCTSNFKTIQMKRPESSMILALSEVAGGGGGGDDDTNSNNNDAEEEDASIQQLKERVRGLLDMTPSMLADGASMPSSTASLEAAYKSGDYNDMFVLFIEFFMDMKLEYDMEDDGDDMCRPTVHACTDPEDDVTKDKLPQLYNMAMTMMDGTSPELKFRIWRLVVDKLASRVGMENDVFVDW
eukprot:CAMPEP_0198252786 /NCGR_PEP_ID=MMETSP1447-20131203/3258_1 /TAXON_ID=420782 /ORGANISM="Chaetoceros dichaeta, Strain CCMP1751" /LENGTH=206 /DNA_ID=CAMNT_0043938169 /DNA_START=38 /DNA_END=655 /DNA_ORIENTATION=-